MMNDQAISPVPQGNPSICLTLQEDFSQICAQSPHLEWVEMALHKVVVATGDRAWLLRLDADYYAPQLLPPMQSTGSIATTRQLLDGAIAAAKDAVNGKTLPTLTASRKVWRLAGAYHLCLSIPPLMQMAFASFAAGDRYRLARWAIEQAKAEADDDLVILPEIQALGYDAAAVVKVLVPSMAVALVDYLARSVQDDDPVDCVGYIYALERLATSSEEYTQEVEIALLSGINAVRHLRPQSSGGVERDYLKEIVAMVAGLTAPERVRVAKACYETALLCFSSPSEGYLTDTVLQLILSASKTCLPKSAST